MPGQEGFISFNTWTALFTLLNTITLFLVLKRFLFKPLMKLIEERQNEIDTMYAEADEAKNAAHMLQSEYQARLDAAAETTDRLVKEAVVRGQRREEEIVQKANAQADAILQKASADIAQEKKKMLNEAKDEISGIAIQIAEKVVGRQLQEQDQSRLFEEFINELGEQP